MGMALGMRAIFEVGERVSQGDGVMTKAEFISAEMGTRVTAHAMHVGDRINTMNLEGEILSAVPLAIRVNKTGIAVLFRYGVAVLIGLSPEDETGFLERLKPRIGGKLTRFEEETAIIALAGEAEDQVQAGGPIQLRDMSPERLLVIADVLWDRPDLERLYARLEDEYELKERVDTLSRKLAVIAETANTLADIIDTRRSLRLELIVVVLIAFEIVITFYQIYAARGH